MGKKQYSGSYSTPEVEEPGVAPTDEPMTPSEVVAEPVAEPIVEKPVDPSALMPLRVYVTIAGPKWDQMAGFVSWAQQKKLAPRTMEQWTADFESFKNRPVG